MSLLTNLMTIWKFSGLSVNYLLFRSFKDYFLMFENFTEMLLGKSMFFVYPPEHSEDLFAFKADS